ncbi:MAG: sigma 54-interacting transcriptional regulator [Ignavibacteriae bacterium]|nr:sigma 54-interacting transcriptional regulator [Ignavibacteriota bacterium]
MNILVNWVLERDLKYFIRDEKSVEFSSIIVALKEAEKINFDKVYLLYDTNINEKLNEFLTCAEYETTKEIEALVGYMELQEYDDIVESGKEFKGHKNFLPEAFLTMYESSLNNYCKKLFSERKNSSQNLPIFEFIEMEINKNNISNDIIEKLNSNNCLPEEIYFCLNKTNDKKQRSIILQLAFYIGKNPFLFKSENEAVIFLTSNNKYKYLEKTSSIYFYTLKLVNDYYPNEDDTPTSFNNIVTANKELMQILRDCDTASKTEDPILLLGETGTGKELFANGIHKASSRSDKEFVPINCGAIPNNLIESELFGYEKGAFTGADKPKAGLFETVNEGTIFLDEIGELPMELQSKLLRVLQERKFRRMGSVKEIPFKARIISATNVNITSNFGVSFRSDLYYRISTYVFKIPPLRKRGKRDLELLIEYFLEKYNDRQDNYYKIFIQDSAKQFLYNYDWPGNVRQFESNFKRAYYIALQKDKDIDENIFKSAFDFEPDNNERIIENNMPPEKETTEDNKYSDFYQVKFFNGFKLKELLNNIEKDYIIEALNKSRTQKSAGKVLGYSQQLILNKIKKYNLLAK